MPSRPCWPATPPGPVNVATGDAPQVRELVAAVATAAGDPDLVQFGARPAPPNDPPEIRADIDPPSRRGRLVRADAAGGGRRAHGRLVARAARGGVGMSKPVVLLGSGMATLGAAYRLRAEGAAYVMFDKGNHPGGHTKTYAYDGGWVFDDGPHVSFTENERIQGILAEQVGRRLPPGPDRREQPLAGPLDQAPGPDQPARAARRTWSCAASRTSSPRRPGPQREIAELRGLADRLVRADVRRDVPDALHAQDPHDRREEHDRRLDGAADVPAQARGGAARRALAEHVRRALHRPVPLPEPRRLLLVPPPDPRGVRPAHGPRGRARRPEGAAGPLPQRRASPTTAGWCRPSRSATSSR